MKTLIGKLKRFIYGTKKDIKTVIYTRCSSERQHIDKARVKRQLKSLEALSNL